MVRDAILTMSNRQTLAVDAAANTIASSGTADSTNAVPEPSLGPTGFPETSGETPYDGLKWTLMYEEDTSTPIQLEGNLHAELQFSLDNGSTWQTGDGLEIQLDDPALPANGRAIREAVFGRNFKDRLAVTDPTQVRFKTVYSVSGRVGGDGACDVAATSYLGY